jgi:hypothetical protein
MEIFVVEKLSRGFAAICPYKNVFKKRWTEKHSLLLQRL